MRDGLRTLLELEDDLEVVGEAENGHEALKLYEKVRPSVTLMDVRMPVMDGVEATRQLRQHWPDARVIILTTFDDDEYVFERMGQAPRSGSAKLVELLFKREEEVLCFIVNDYANKKIANCLFLVEGTVKNYVTSILGKIGVRDRTQAALRARELGLV